MSEDDSSGRAADLPNETRAPMCSRGNRSTSDPLDHRTFDHLRVEAFRPPLFPNFPGGPVLLDPAFAHFRHKRADRPSDTFDPQASFDKYLEGDWAYFGIKYPHHFGHIMAEMVHRIIPSKIFFPDVNQYLLVTTIDDDDILGHESLGKTYHEILDFCEIDPNSIRIINSNTVVEHLSICEQGANLEGHPMPWYLEALRDFSTRRLNQIHARRSRHGKVYVSKSKIPHGGKILGERYIEELLTKEGFFIFYPEEAPFSVQMDVYRKAEELVFSEGSAFHGTEFLGRKMLHRTSLVVRRRDASDVFARVLQPRSKQFEMFLETFLLGTIFVGRETRFPHSEFAVSLLDLDRFVTFFRDHQLARLDGLDVRRYFDAAETDLKAYFSYQMPPEVEADPWRIGEVRLEFEKLRQRFLAGRVRVGADLATQMASWEDATKIEELAWAAHYCQKWLEAAERWEVYRERFPDLETGFALGAIALIELGRFYEADALLRVAMEKFPDSPDVHSSYALAAHRRRDWRESLARCEAFRGKFPQANIGYSLGATALCELGQYADADNLLRPALKEKPNEEELLEKYAWVAQLSDNAREAKRRWRKLKASYPNNQAAVKYCQGSPGRA
jgi:tetratricopeptide (TPR) repeat protein